jgi:hypothetical protein
MLTGFSGRRDARAPGVSGASDRIDTKTSWGNTLTFYGQIIQSEVVPWAVFRFAGGAGFGNVSGS